MKMLFLSLALLLCSSSFGQNFIQFYEDLADSIQQDTITKYLMEFESYGVKEYNTTELQNARDWLVNKYTDWGYSDIVQDDFDVFGGNTLTNIIVTKTGTLYPNTYVIIDGHYDTKTGTGTNDNGTGTAILLELARIIKDIPTEYSIKFIHFSGEEIGLFGSDHYVNSVVVPNNMDIKVVFNIDEVGGINGMVNNTIVCEQDESQPHTNDAQSSVMTNELATCTGLYSTLQTEISFAYASDYVPFMNQDYIVTGYYEKNETPYAHSPNDSIAHVDIPYVYQVCRGAMGGLLHFAVAYEPPVDTTSSVVTLNTSLFSLYPNPASDIVTIQAKNPEITAATVLLYDLSGALLLKKDAVANNGAFQIDVSTVSPGAYVVKIATDSGIYTGKLLHN